jgi:hypothetical protein
MRIKTLLLFLGLAVAMPVAVHAETAVYGEFTGATLSVTGLPNIYGGTFGVYTQKKLGLVALGGDVRGFNLGGGNSQNYSGVVAGPRLAIKPRVLPISPYIELLGGFSRVSVSGNSNTDLAYNFVVGVDYTVIPHVDWRAIEYTYGEEHTSPLAYKALSTGLVVRF